METSSYLGELDDAVAGEPVLGKGPVRLGPVFMKILLAHVGLAPDNEGESQQALFGGGHGECNSFIYQIGVKKSAVQC